MEDRERDIKRRYAEGFGWRQELRTNAEAESRCPPLDLWIEPSQTSVIRTVTCSLPTSQVSLDVRLQDDMTR